MTSHSLEDARDFHKTQSPTFLITRAARRAVRAVKKHPLRRRNRMLTRWSHNRFLATIPTG